MKKFFYYISFAMMATAIFLCTSNLLSNYLFSFLPKTNGYIAIALIGVGITLKFIADQLRPARKNQFKIDNFELIQDIKKKEEEKKNYKKIFSSRRIYQ